MDTVEGRLARAGLTLPPAVGTRFGYRPIVIDGTNAYLAGQLAKGVGDAIAHPGIVGREIDLQTARGVARDCALQALAWLKHELGTLTKVQRVLRLNGYVRVASPEGFGQMSEVIDGASEVFVTAFDDTGHHVRSVLGLADLPRHASVMIDLTVRIDSG